ncbi:ribokinase [Jiangella sp. DSM 45060]|uniref:ribokinase n=1 Tax=Jiangella sp. DSM 45060 TaxID=1798224 RepID=UPI00087D20BA|nr:ribokinase [Jiangella sp. DSM 45060]SDT13141.1 ribokinase [Jiangella sp. DSM 45060]
MTARVVVVGSLNVDRTFRVDRLPAAGHTIHARSSSTSPGGKGANQAVAAALLGADVALVGAVGRDGGGDDLLASVAAAGVDVTGVVRADAPTGEAVVLVDADAENLIVVNGGANLCLDAAAVTSAVRAARFVVTGFEVPDDAVVAAAARARELGARFVLNPSPMRPLPGGLLGPGVLLVVNEHESAMLAGDTEGCDVLVTLGARGALLHEAASGRTVELVAPRVDAVDTTGCGDAFMGALVAGLAADLDPADAAARAVDAGAYVATRPGAQGSYPTSEELTRWRRGRQ